MTNAGSQARRTLLQALAVLGLGGGRAFANPPHEEMVMSGRIKWVAYYGATADEQALAAYEIVVLDPMFQGSVAAVAAGGARVCGYLSLGEIRTADAFFRKLDGAAVLEPNPAWPGTRRLDVRHRAWEDLVLAEIIPAIRDAGFSGLMLDTLDTPPFLERVDPRANHGMGEAAAGLVSAIRQSYPDMMLVVNRGYDLLPAVAGDIDAVIAESLLTMPAGRGEAGYRWTSEAELRLQLSLLAPAARRQPCLPVLSLDYWSLRDELIIKEIYRRERLLGHHPYVATPSLDRIITEPAN
jgi:polysaccharide biosynthesis protein PelA